MTAPRMQHYSVRRHTLAEKLGTLFRITIVTSELTQGWRNPDPSVTSIHSKRFRLRGKPNPTFSLQVAEAFSKALFCLCVWESCMAICGHLVSVRRRREMILSFTQSG